MISSVETTEQGRLVEVRQPVLGLAGRHDRTCWVADAEAIARGIPGARPVFFGNSAQITFGEVPEATRPLWKPSSSPCAARHRAADPGIVKTPWRPS